MKVQYPGGVSATYRPGLPGVCGNTSDVFIPVEYTVPCCTYCPGCAIKLTIYDSVVTACDIVLDGTDGTESPNAPLPEIVLDGST